MNQDYQLLILAYPMKQAHSKYNVTIDNGICIYTDNDV